MIKTKKGGLVIGIYVAELCHLTQHGSPWDFLVLHLGNGYNTAQTSPVREPKLQIRILANDVLFPGIGVPNTSMITEGLEDRSWVIGRD